jgi:hypothetical protein
MNRVALRAALPAFVVVVAVLAPFHDRAFTIDDTFFLRGALHAATDPLHPSAYDIVWQDAPERVAPTGGLLQAWLLVPAVVSPSPESVAHLTELGFLCLAVLATVGLALRLGLATRWATVAGLLLATTPTALAMAGTAMADVPAMGLGAVGVERLVAWRQERKLHQAILAALALALAPLARPHSILFLGVGALFLLDDLFAPATWLRSGIARWLPLPAAVLLTAAILAVTWDTAPGAPGLFAVTSRLSSHSWMANNAVAFPTHWVLVFPLAVPWLALRPGSILRRWWLLLGAVVALFALQMRSGGASLFISVAAGLGVAVLWDIVADGLARRDATQLVLGLWLLLPLAALPYSHFPAKFNLAAAPAAAILVARLLATVRLRRAGVVLGLTASLGIALGIAILRADSAFGELGRRAVAELIRPHVEAGRRVWFVGHWGFQWYAERAGARPVTVTPPFPEPGDLIAISRNSNKGLVVSKMILDGYVLSPVARLEDSTPGGRVMTEGAGFYSNRTGSLPWIWGREPIDAISVWHVVALKPTRTAVP